MKIPGIGRYNPARLVAESLRLCRSGSVPTVSASKGEAKVKTCVLPLRCRSVGGSACMGKAFVLRRRSSVFFPRSPVYGVEQRAYLPPEPANLPRKPGIRVCSFPTSPVAAWWGYVSGLGSSYRRRNGPFGTLRGVLFRDLSAASRTLPGLQGSVWVCALDSPRTTCSRAPGPDSG